METERGLARDSPPRPVPSGIGPLLDVRGLRKSFRGRGFRSSGSVLALAGVDLTLGRGKSLAIIGESGCGKSTLARLLVGVETPDGGAVFFDGEDVTALRGRARSRWRRRCQMMFQDALEALNPRHTVRTVLEEASAVAGGLADRDWIDWLETVGLGRGHGDRYPHQLSGGQRQRLALARVMAVMPELLVLDEPVSGLDAGLRRQILRVIEGQRRERGMAQVIISHDLGVARQADRLAVMYLGAVVEEGPASEVLARPRHPYTAGLLASRPRLDGAQGRYTPMAGEVPSAVAPPGGCPFHPRCRFAEERCARERPSPGPAGAIRRVACFKPLADDGSFPIDPIR